MSLALKALLVVVAIAAIASVLRWRAQSEVVEHVAPVGFQARPFDLASLVDAELVARETGFFGLWHETTRWARRVAYQGAGDQLYVYAGDFDPDAEQITQTYLSQVSPQEPLPKPSSQRRLASWLGDGAPELDARFFLNATGGDAVEPLEIPAVRAALLGLSEHVRQVHLLESGGVQLELTAPTPDALRSDVARALELVEALPARSP